MSNSIPSIFSSVDITILVYSVSQGPSFTWGGITFYLNTTLNTILEPYCYTANTTFIPDSQVPGFDALTFVLIGNLVTNISAGAFSGCTALTNILLLPSVTSIGDSAFLGCTALTDIEMIFSSLTSIGNNAFSGCTNLNDFIFNSSLISIGNNAFNNCTALTSVKIPTSVISIGSDAFSGSGLQHVTIINNQIISNITFTSPFSPVSFFGKSVNTLLPQPTSTGDDIQISGTTVVGGIIILNNSFGWNDMQTYPITYTYQWYRGNSQIGGATSSSYTTVEADIGNANAITCDIVATNVAGSTTPIKSINSIIVAPSPQLPLQPTPPTPSQFTSLPSVLSITVDGDLKYMYAHYIDLNVPGSYIAKIDANNGTIINSEFITTPHIDNEFTNLNGILSEFLSQVLVVDNDLYMTFEKYIYKVTNINTNSPGTPSIWFTSNVTTNDNALLADLVRDGTYIYTTDVLNKCIMQVSLASSGTSSNTPWATLIYNPFFMTINNGYMYVTCIENFDNVDQDRNSYISKINISDPSNPINAWVTTGSFVYAFGIAIYGSYMYIALNYLSSDGPITLGSYICLIYLSNGEGIIQNPNWVTIPNQFLSSAIIGGIKKVIITEKNQNVNLYTCDDIIQIPLYGSPVPPISDICFPAGTPITTDQGIIAIEKINPSIHTINKKPIVDIIRTIYNDKYLIGFKKNAISINCPSQFTVMTKNHKIIWQGRKLEAESFLYRYENVVKVKYSGQILYNVLMEEHSEMVVNNMLCETLDPNNTVAKLYKRTSKYTKSERYKISKFIADSVKNTKFDRHKTYRNIIKKL